MKWYALLPIVAAISVGVRLFPFMVGDFLRRFSFLKKLSVMLPCCLLIMVTAYTLHGTDFSNAWPEIGALLGVVLTQVLFRTITISMLAGVLLHQLLRLILLTS
ncbi:MAG: hypothetical protein S4CHLAM81_04570 [Chlamydiales bacterium]|nr:hypothetical protein [Chlamydiales bacterium]MCH9635246.1 hypothetical protein [Chlamydiales bacterium]MCH9703452.1 AzlD domain-containing protein [Chlamydiota bacterium]